MAKISNWEESTSPALTDYVAMIVGGQDRKVQIANLGVAVPAGSTNDLQKKGVSGLAASGLNDNGTTLSLSRKRVLYPAITNNPILGGSEELLTSDELGSTISIPTILSGDGGVLFEALLTAAWKDNTGAVVVRTLKPSRQFLFDTVNGNGSTTQQNLEDTQLNPDNAVSATLTFSAGNFILTLFGRPAISAPAGVHWTVRFELTVSKTPT